MNMLGYFTLNLLVNLDLEILLNYLLYHFKHNHLEVSVILEETEQKGLISKEIMDLLFELKIALFLLSR